VEGNKDPVPNNSEERNCPELSIQSFPVIPSFIIVSPGITSSPPLELSSVEIRDPRCIESESRGILCTFWR
jgi:hypothetical protein